MFYKFGHKRPDFQAQVFEASVSKPAERPGIDVKPVLAALIPSASAAEVPRPEARQAAAAETVKDAAPQPAASAQPVKPVAAAKTDVPAA